MCAKTEQPLFDAECRRCPRLSDFLEDVSEQYPDYFAAPVPAFGDPAARLLASRLQDR